MDGMAFRMRLRVPGAKKQALPGRSEVLTLLWILLLTAVEAWQARLEKATSGKSGCDRARRSHCSKSSSFALLTEPTGRNV